MMIEQRALFEAEFVVKHNFRVSQPKWNASYTKWFGDRNQGRIVSASSEEEAVGKMAKKFRLNASYLIAAPATAQDKKVAKGMDEALLERAAPLGSGERFKALTRKLKAKGAKDPAALAAWIGRKKYGKKKMAKLSAKGRRSEGVFDEDLRGRLLAFAEARMGKPLGWAAPPKMGKEAPSAGALVDKWIDANRLIKILSVRGEPERPDVKRPPGRPANWDMAARKAVNQANYQALLGTVEDIIDEFGGAGMKSEIRDQIKSRMAKRSEEGRAIKKEVYDRAMYFISTSRARLNPKARAEARLLLYSLWYNPSDA